jgi:hypothetical protein
MTCFTKNHTACSCLISLTGFLLLFSGCGINSTQSAAHGFGMTTASQTSATVSSIEVNSTSVNSSGGSVAITVDLAEPSPAGGVTVQLSSSDPLTVKVPATLHIAAGQSSATVELSASASPRSPSVVITASDGDSLARASVNLASAAGTRTDAMQEPLAMSNATGNPNATFKGCWYKTKKARYQGVEISVGAAGSYPFNAVLYNGTTCKPTDVADQFGFGNPIALGKETYIFWFTDFMNKRNMSALWYLGNQKSKCVAYTVAPTC